MTGRAAGYCAGFPLPGFMNPYGGRMGGWFGRGQGRGWGYPGPGWMGGVPHAWSAYGAPYSAEQEKQALVGQVKYFESQLESLKKRLVELETEAADATE